MKTYKLTYWDNQLMRFITEEVETKEKAEMRKKYRALIRKPWQPMPRIEEVEDGQD